MAMRPQLAAESRGPTQVASAGSKGIGGIGSDGGHTCGHQRGERNEATATGDGVDHAAN